VIRRAQRTASNLRPFVFFDSAVRVRSMNIFGEGRHSPVSTLLEGLVQ
jgi:hypothetical protein